MKKFNIMFILLLAFTAAAFLAANLCFDAGKNASGRPWQVEIERLCKTISSGSEPDISHCEYVTAVVKDDGSSDFYKSRSENTIKQVGAQLYRFDYDAGAKTQSSSRLVMNLSLSVLSAVVILAFLYIRLRILKPFNRISSVPYDLSKGNLTRPLEENKSRYFGKFVWGVNMLRENMLEQKEHELKLLKDKQTLILSISHDIKTPLSAIKLYSKAMSKGLYSDKEKMIETAKNIDKNADDIEKFVTQLTRSASEDFIELDVVPSEFYLSQIITDISTHYAPQLSERHTEFKTDDFIDCLILGDCERSIEVLKNLMDNALKYGDGKYIHIRISEEDGCKLICVANSGCSLPQGEMLSIFDSFWRGSNSQGRQGSGLGLYICRQLMLKMNGDIFAEQSGGEMRVTAVFPKA
ncbi:MAG: HAMP domain-containing histidine kinase [Ruminococcus sp.]|nr:HAMP domain-containing histidine kinase [Ruminococcus sp.]